MALGGRDVLKLVVDADSAGAVREFDKLGRGIKSSLGDAEKQAQGLSGKLGKAFDGLAAKSPMVAGALDKVGMSGTQAGAAIASALPVAGLAAGAAITAFAIKAVGDFQKTALAAGKFADASGLGVESASRWLEVAGDIGVSNETISSVFIKMEKSIASNREAWGDLIVTAKDGSTDLTASALNAIKHLQGIKDPIERANESAKLFGRDFKAVAEILGMNADDLKKRLDSVGEGQVISPAELEKARAYRDAMEELRDKVQGLTLDLGGALVPVITDATEALTGLVGVGEKLTGPLGGLGAVFGQIAKNAPGLSILTGLGGAFESGASGVDRFGSAVRIAVPVLGHLIQGLDGSNQSAAITRNVFGEATSALTEFAGSFAPIAETAEATATRVNAAFALMKGNLSADEAILNLQDSFARVGDSAAEAWAKAASGEAGAEQAVRNNAKAVIDLKQQVVSYGAEILGLPPERVTELLAQIDRGDLAGAENDLNTAARARDAKMTAVPSSQAAADEFNRLVKERQAKMLAWAETATAGNSLDNTAKARQANINAIAHTGDAESDLQALTRTRIVNVIQHVTTSALFGIPHGASGFRNFSGGLAVVGEEGPELVSLPRGSDVYSNAESMAGGPSALPKTSSGGRGGTTIIFNGPVLDSIAFGRAVIQAKAAAERAGVN